MFTDLRPRWTGAAWRAEAEAWIRAVLAARGIKIVGPVEQVRVRTWSTQLTVPTTDGLLWFKENHPGQRAEAAIVQVLARLAPAYVVVPLAVDVSRGWLLARDHGPTLARLRPSPDEDTWAEDTWARVMTDYARLQRLTAGHRDQLTAAGLVPLLPADVAEHLERAVEAMRAAPAGSAVHIDAELGERVTAALPALRATAARLTELAPLASLEHNDLHLDNVFAPTLEDPTSRFFDWGDAVWAHPFTSLRVPVGSMCQDWSSDAADPRVMRVVDAYLDEWADVANRPVLWEAAALAQRLGTVHRFESWRRLCASASAAAWPDEANAVRAWLDQVAQTPYPRS